MSKTTPNRRRLVPEVIQTSAMDCGPAALGSFLQGHRINVSYPALRQSCHTDVDGTSIDTLEELAVSQGLDAEQVMVPADHFLLESANNLPAILIINNAEGTTHFIVVWRKNGNRLQVMDPAIGRRWITMKQLLDEAFRHQMPVPADDWHQWARSEEFTGALQSRMENVIQQRSKQLISYAAEHSNWCVLARLDAVTRMTQSLINAQLIRAGRAAKRFVESMMDESLIETVEDIPEQFWSAYPVSEAPSDAEELQLRGVVLVRSRGKSKSIGDQTSANQMNAIGDGKWLSPAWYLFSQLASLGPTWLFVVFAGLLVAAASVIFEVILFRGAMEITSQLRLTEQRWTALVYFLGFIVAMLVIEWKVVGAILAAGRRLEIGLRIDFLSNLARLKDRYFTTRPISDMAHRAHNIHYVRELPALAGQIIQTLLTIALTATALCLVFSGGMAVIILAAVTAILLPFSFRRRLLERDLKVRTHAGALANSYFDALAGVVPIRAHGAQRTVRRQHESLLTVWAKSSLQLVNSIVLLESLVMIAGFGLAVLLVLLHFQQGENPAGSLLVSYWALHLPVLGDQLSKLIAQLPLHRNLVLRAIEPMSVAAQGSTAVKHGSNFASAQSGVELQLKEVTTLAGGQPILANVNLQIEAGEHVAVIGQSGAGKSSLAGLLLGLHQCDRGEVLVNGELLEDQSIECLRHMTAWVDPGVRLWNTTMLANLMYGIEQPAVGLDQVCKLTGLDKLVAKLPNGLQTKIGPNGSQLSTGEAQLIRFARALLKPNCGLVVLDEPLFGIETHVQFELLQLLRTHWRHATLLNVTHHVQQALTFPRVIVMGEGQILEDGRPSELATDPNSLFSKMFDNEKEVERHIASAPWRTIRLQQNGIVDVPSLSLSVSDHAVKHA